MKGVERKLFIELLRLTSKEDNKRTETYIRDTQTAGSDWENV